MVLNYIKHLNLVILIVKVTGCISISAFASLVSISTGSTSSAVVLKIYAITVRFNKYKSIIKKKRSMIN